MKPIWVGLLTLSGIGALLFVILMPLSFKQIAFDEYGIKYHRVSKDLDEEVEEQGRYHVQVGETFFKFKRRVVTVNFISTTDEALSGVAAEGTNYGSVFCMSSDGVVVETSDTFQYQLRKEKLADLFQLFGEDYEQVIVKMAQSAIRDACSVYTIEDFYNNRGAIQNTMLNKTKHALENIFVDCTNLQLLAADLPDRYEFAVAAKEEARADVDQAIIEREEILIKSRTEVLEAQEEAKIIILKAKAEADAILSFAENEAKAIELELAEKAIVYKTIMQNFGLTPQGLINYISIEQLQEAEHVSVSVKSPAEFSYADNGQ